MNFAALDTSTDFASSDVAQRDIDLLTKARAGSNAAFEEIQGFYSPRLYRRIYSITRNREDAEDALQDTFLHAFAALKSFRGKSQFSTWLTRIAVNAAIMTIRRRRSRPEVSFEQRSESEKDIASFEIVDVALNPEQICVRKQQYSSMLRAIEQRLDPKSRSVVAFWVSKGCSMKEAAHSLNVSLATVKSRLHRARKRLSRSSM
jgi:RNA polymerase sigma-70 factor (ECF subfamily)